VRLFQTCFNDEVGKAVWRERFKGFKGAPHRKRFASISFAVPCARFVERPLRERWSAVNFLRGKQPQSRRGADEEGDNEEDTGKFIDFLDRTIHDRGFWGWLVMIDATSDNITFLMCLSTSCPCHWELEKFLRSSVGEKLPAPLRDRLWKIVVSCPRKGRRGQDYSQGIIFTEFNWKTDMTSGELAMSLPGDLDATTRSSLMQEFYHGVNGLKFYLVLKFTHWQEKQWLLYRLGCPHRETKVAALRQLLDMPPCHARVAQIQREPIRSQALRFIAGESVFSATDLNANPGMEELLQVMASACFAWTLEWLGEAGGSGRLPKHCTPKYEHNCYKQT